MPNKSKKSKSKRSTLKHKYKVIKKVKQHLQKKAKEEKKAKKAGKKPSKTKDPGIPSQWPFKDELLKDLEWQKQRILGQEKLKKESKKKKRVAEEDAEVEDEEMHEPLSAADLQQAALNKHAEFKANKKAKLEKPSAANDKDGSRRAFYKEFVKVVSAADVVIEVLDARDPLGSRCEDVERFVRRAGSDKKIILLLNKIDLVPKEVAEAWLKFLREELPTVAFKCSTQKQAVNLKQGKAGKGKKGSKAKFSASAALQTSESLGAETLLQLLKNYTRNMDIKTAITVGVVGLPNVGKSSLINSLKRARVANVGNQPGVTRTVQEISLDKHINLLDSPGMVFSASPANGDSWAALRNCVKVEQLEDPRSVAAEIVKRCPAKQLMALYNVPTFKDAEDFLQLVAFQRGRLLPGGIGDSHTAARIVLHDWHNGKIAYYTMPPKRGDVQHEDAAVLDTWSEVFNADKVFANEKSAVIAGLPSLDEGATNFIATDTAGPAPTSLDAMDAESEEDDSAAEGEEGADSDEDSSEDSDVDDDSDNDIPQISVPGLERHSRAMEKKVEQVNAKAPRVAQAEKLYTAQGQYNPKLAKAEKKRAKKAKKLSLGDDYNFVEAFADEVQLDDAVANGKESNDMDEDSE